MKAVVQRVLKASVEVDGEVISSIGRGLCVLIGISRNDTKKDCEYIARKLLNLRIFEDENGKRWCHSVKDMKYEILLVSQFTLYCTLKGNKPDFHLSMGPEKSETFYKEFVGRVQKDYNPDLVKDGKFGAYMQVNIQNDGPVTINLESPTQDVQIQKNAGETVKRREPQNPTVSESSNSKDGGFSADMQTDVSSDSTTDTSIDSPATTVSRETSACGTTSAQGRRSSTVSENSESSSTSEEYCFSFTSKSSHGTTATQNLSDTSDTVVSEISEPSNTSTTSKGYSFSLPSHSTYRTTSTQNLSDTTVSDDSESSSTSTISNDNFFSSQGTYKTTSTKDLSDTTLSENSELSSASSTDTECCFPPSQRTATSSTQDLSINTLSESSQPSNTSEKYSFSLPIQSTSGTTISTQDHCNITVLENMKPLGEEYCSSLPIQNADCATSAQNLFSTRVSDYAKSSSVQHCFSAPFQSTYGTGVLCLPSGNAVTLETVSTQDFCNTTLPDNIEHLSINENYFCPLPIEGTYEATSTHGLSTTELEYRSPPNENYCFSVPFQSTYEATGMLGLSDTIVSGNTVALGATSSQGLCNDAVSENTVPSNANENYYLPPIQSTCGTASIPDLLNITLLENTTPVGLSEEYSSHPFQNTSGPTGTLYPHDTVMAENPVLLATTSTQGLCNVTVLENTEPSDMVNLQPPVIQDLCTTVVSENPVVLATTNTHGLCNVTVLENTEPLDMVNLQPPVMQDFCATVVSENPVVLATTSTQGLCSVTVLENTEPLDMINLQPSVMQVLCTTVVSENQKLSNKFSCDLCGKIFSRKFCVVRHKNAEHGLKKTSRRCGKGEPALICSICEKRFKNKKCLQLHKKSIHNILPQFKHHFKCFKCSSSFPTTKLITEHILQNHTDINMKMEHVTFESEEEFHKWKEDLENRTVSWYVTANNYKNMSCRVKIYHCYRNGMYKSSSTGKRHVKIGGSNKIEFFCPARIQTRIFELSDEFRIDVTYCLTHIGHECELGKLRLSEEGVLCVSQQTQTSVAS